MMTAEVSIYLSVSAGSATTKRRVNTFCLLPFVSVLSVCYLREILSWFWCSFTSERCFLCFGIPERCFHFKSVNVFVLIKSWILLTFCVFWSRFCVIVTPQKLKINVTGYFQMKNPKTNYVFDFFYLLDKACLEEASSFNTQMKHD